MDFAQHLSDLKVLDNPDGVAFSRCSAAVREALLARDKAGLNQLLAHVSKSDDVVMQDNFDTLMDLLCSEPNDPEDGSVQWRAFAMTVTTDCTAGLGLLRCDDYRPVERALADYLGLPVGEARILPLLLPSTMAYDFGPLEAYSHCQASIRWAAGHARYQMPIRPDTNKLVSAEEGLASSESVAFLVLQLDEADSAEVAVELQRLASHLTEASPRGFPLTARDEHGKTHDVVFSIVHAGTPWRTLGDSLHSLETLQAGRMVRAQMHRHKLRAADIRCSAVYVENTDDTSSVRVACIGPAGLLAGMSFHDMHEPEVFIDKLDQLLVTLGCAEVQQVPQTYFSVEADEDGANPRYFVPGVGWQDPPPALASVAM